MNLINGFGARGYSIRGIYLPIVLSHCIAEIRVYWVETKPSEIDNPRHDYQTA